MNVNCPYCDETIELSGVIADSKIQCYSCHKKFYIHYVSDKNEPRIEVMNEEDYNWWAKYSSQRGEIEGGPSTMDKECVQNSDVEDERNIFDYVGDFFYKMVRGILIVVFKKIPKFLSQYIWSFLRAVFWLVVWVVFAFAPWMVLSPKYFNFRRWCNCLRFVYADYSQIVSKLCGLEFSTWGIGDWTIVAWTNVVVWGSIYGIVYVTLKRRAHRKGVEFNGVLRGIIGCFRKHKRLD